jgi:hypothetical protein
LIKTPCIQVRVNAQPTLGTHIKHSKLIHGLKDEKNPILYEKKVYFWPTYPFWPMLPTTKPKMAYYIRDIYLTSSKNPKLIPGLKTEKKIRFCMKIVNFFAPPSTTLSTLLPTPNKRWFAKLETHICHLEKIRSRSNA